MKKFIYSSAVVCLLFFGATLKAQESVKYVGNIAAQPLWGPTGFNNVAFYYLPDLESYYNVNEKKFIYFEKGRWVFSETLPEAHKDYDLYSGYKVVINRPQAYLNFAAHKRRYANFLGQKNKQVAIINSTNSKYFVVTGHPQEEKLSHNKE